MSKKFTKNKENFVCEHCGKEVIGNGYTNHCPFCLWGKHVDVNPGDRAHTCLGLMEPIGLEVKKGGEYRIIHVCTRCKERKINRLAPNDDMELALSIHGAKNRLG